MPSQDRRSAGRRRAWGRGPIILKFDALERREVMSALGSTLPDLVTSSLVTDTSADWGDPVTATGQVTNQGRSTVTTAFNVGIYASSKSTVGKYSVLLGEVTIPAGLEPGQSVPFTTTVKLPTTQVPGVSSNGVVYIDTKVDPEGVVKESNRRNNTGVGAGFDSVALQVAPHQQAALTASGIGVYPTAVDWGGTMQVTAQIKNESYGVAPATRALVVLTPAGSAFGSLSDLTIGSISVPTIPAWSSVNVETSVTLPSMVPRIVEGSSSYTLTIVPDGDYETNTTYPRNPVGGVGVDQTPVTVNTTDTTPTTTAETALPNLAPGGVTVSSGTLSWGNSFQVSTVLQNLGSADPGAFRVRFVLVNGNGDTTAGLFLGDTVIQGLAPGTTQTLTQSLTLPNRLPAGVTLSSSEVGRIAVIVDPEHVINESFSNNNTAMSGPVNLKLLGSDGSTYVPNYPAPKQLLAVNNSKLAARADARAAAAAAKAASTAQHRKLYRKPVKTNSVLHSLSVFPKSVNNFIKKYV
ncbi:CARDB domain-containing protein [Aquisphaera insulae]|uniref:CARDB domain-containing protein n=1 Tax=Aquisphaera insulae TaxID=2712864 RepID=UPI0013ECFE47|nr:CARDB domain-containing protein [Aquisphaera insulae]